MVKLKHFGKIETLIQSITMTETTADIFHNAMVLYHVLYNNIQASIELQEAGEIDVYMSTPQYRASCITLIYQVLTRDFIAFTLHNEDGILDAASILDAAYNQIPELTADYTDSVSNTMKANMINAFNEYMEKYYDEIDT